jgi:hypothetical protein
MKFDTTQNYVEDPESLKFEAVKAERKAIREKYGNTVFRPSSTPKSLRTSSVANHPRNQVCVSSGWRWTCCAQIVLWSMLHRGYLVTNFTSFTTSYESTCSGIEDILLPFSPPSFFSSTFLDTVP